MYVSNESQEPVYFDNLQVAHTRGRIAEETHYYSYGLQIAAISSRKVADPREGTVDNRYGYNDKELWDDADLNWLDYGFRNYDPQIGRFVQLDPLTDFYPEYSPYQYAGLEPIANVDVDGLFGEGILSTTAATAKTLSGVTVTAVRSTATVVKAGSTLMSGLRMGISVSSVLVHSAQAAIGVINTSVTVQQVGGAVAGNGPDDYIYVNTKTKQVDIIETNDDFDLVTIDGGPEVGRQKGKTEREYRDKGYNIFKPKGVGMDLVDNVIITIGGGKAIKWTFGAARGWWVAREAAKRTRNIQLIKEVTKKVNLAGRIAKSDMTNAEAGTFFGWGKGLPTKSIKNFSKEILEKNGWTQDVLKTVAEGYRKIASVDPGNPSALHRAKQLESLLKLFD